MYSWESNRDLSVAYDAIPKERGVTRVLGLWRQVYSGRCMNNNKYMYYTPTTALGRTLAKSVHRRADWGSTSGNGTLTLVDPLIFVLVHLFASLVVYESNRTHLVSPKTVTI